jgi:hypothetical protein
LFVVAAGHVDVSFPDPVVGYMSRSEVRELAEFLLRGRREAETN